MLPGLTMRSQPITCMCVRERERERERKGKRESKWKCFESVYVSLSVDVSVGERRMKTGALERV